MATRNELSQFLASMERRTFRPTLFSGRDDENALDIVQGIMLIQKPNWSELSPQHEVVLAPPPGEGDQLESYRRKKWPGTAKGYPGISPEQQQRVSARMKSWAATMPQECNLAHVKFEKTSKTSPERRSTQREKWEQ